MENLTVAVSPHINNRKNTTLVMLDVIIALMPAVVASVLIFGTKSLLLIVIGIISSVAAELLFQLICKKEITIGDLSAVVTGIILALNVPASLPAWQLSVGCVFAVVIVKGLFGGIGQNFANPAATARVMMLLSFGNTMTQAVFPTASDVTASATPLPLLENPDTAEQIPSLLDLFLGKCGGALGETCALALIAGGIYLLIRGVITWHAPVSFIATVFVLSYLFGLPPVASILSGGLMIGAIFMATDYVSSPITKSGRLIFGFGCGLITVLIRKWGVYPEGVSFSILFMNILTPYIDKWTQTKPFGGVKQ